MRCGPFAAALAVLASSVVGYACWRDNERSPTSVDLRADLIRPGAATQLVSPLRATAYGNLLLVADSRLRRVLVVDTATRAARDGFAVAGMPLSLGVLDGQVVVGNAEEGSLQYYDARGRLERSTGQGSVGRPADLAVDQGLGLVFVADAVARMVKVFDAAGNLVRTISGPGLAREQLMAPTGITVDPARRRVLVTDWGNFGSSGGGTASIKIFGYDGAFLSLISGRGRCGMLRCTGGFSRPGGLALDSAGHIYVTDALLAQVLVIDPATGAVVAYLGGRPTLRLPTDVVLLGSDVYVVSNRTASVEVVTRRVRP